jgi:hypothetical protein
MIENYNNQYTDNYSTRTTNFNTNKNVNNSINNTENNTYSYTNEEINEEEGSKYLYPTKGLQPECSKLGLYPSYMPKICALNGKMNSYANCKCEDKRGICKICYPTIERNKSGAQVIYDSTTSSSN